MAEKQLADRVAEMALERVAQLLADRVADRVVDGLMRAGFDKAFADALLHSLQAELAKEGPSPEERGLVPRKKLVSREGKTFEETDWVTADWFEKPENLASMTNTDLEHTLRAVKLMLGQSRKAIVEATKREAPKEELERYKTAEHSSFWTRRAIKRELKKRGGVAPKEKTS